jgi:hypothetical protein
MLMTLFIASTWTIVNQPLLPSKSVVKLIATCKVKSVHLLVILKMSKVIDFFNHIVMKLLLEEMLNLMKIS